MALARVQASAKATSGSSTTLAFSMGTPPTVGNGLIVVAIADRSAGALTPTCADNRGNTYALAGARVNGRAGASVLYCPALTATGAPFTITLTASAVQFWVAQAVEVSGVNTGLAIDQTATASGTSTTPATGATPALTVSDTFQVALHAIANVQSSITVGVVSPAWTQEFEELPYTFAAGEANTRVHTSASGTTPSASWTDTGSQVWAAVLVAFKASASEVARVTQSVVEVLISETVAGRVTHSVLEVLFSAPALVGEIDRRTLTTATGALNATWTPTTTGAWTAGLVALKKT